MNMITTIIAYPKIKKVKLRGIRARRAAWAADGLCRQCGNERPCEDCGARTQKWRDA